MKASAAPLDDSRKLVKVIPGVPRARAPLARAQRLPRSASYFGPDAEHCPGVPLPPQTAPPEHVPQLSVPPQPSPAGPQL